MADPISIVMLWFLISLFIFYLAKDKQNKTKQIIILHQMSGNDFHEVNLFIL